MTRIKVLLFATLRERAGGAKSIEVDLPDGGTVRDLKVHIAKNFPALEHHQPRIRVR